MKGITNIKLIDAKTGEVKLDRTEENAIGPAYQAIVQAFLDDYRNKSNIAGLQNTQMQLINWTYGLALLEEIQPSAPYPMTPEGNIVAIAGQSNNAGASNPKYGNRLEYELLDNSLRQKWQFDTGNANGTINCISLGMYDKIISSGMNWTSMTTMCKHTSLTQYPVWKYKRDMSKAFMKHYLGGAYYDELEAGGKVPTLSQSLYQQIGYGTLHDAFPDVSLGYGGAGGFYDDGYFYVVARDVSTGYRTLFVLDYDNNTVISRHQVDSEESATWYLYQGGLIGDKYVYVKAYTTTDVTLGVIDVTALGADGVAITGEQTMVVDTSQGNVPTDYVWSFHGINNRTAIMAKWGYYADTVNEYGDFFVIDLQNLSVSLHVVSSLAANRSTVSFDAYHGLPINEFWVDQEYDAPYHLLGISNLSMLTINNLGAPIVKTDQDILQVEYTLTF